LHSEAREEKTSLSGKTNALFSSLILWMFSMSFFSLYRVNFRRLNLVFVLVFSVVVVVVLVFSVVVVVLVFSVVVVVLPFWGI